MCVSTRLFWRCGSGLSGCEWRWGQRATCNRVLSAIVLSCAGTRPHRSLRYKGKDPVRIFLLACESSKLGCKPICLEWCAGGFAIHADDPAFRAQNQTPVFFAGHRVRIDTAQVAKHSWCPFVAKQFLETQCVPAPASPRFVVAANGVAKLRADEQQIVLCGAARHTRTGSDHTGGDCAEYRDKKKHGEVGKTTLRRSGSPPTRTRPGWHYRSPNGLPSRLLPGAALLMSCTRPFVWPFGGTKTQAVALSNTGSTGMDRRYLWSTSSSRLSG